MNKMNNLDNFDLMYQEPSFKRRKKDNNYKELYDMYNSYSVKNVSEGETVSATYQGLISNYHIFTIDGLKDDIRVENKPSENKYLKDSKIGDLIDIFISEINQKNYLIKGSLVEMYETRAHENLKTISEGMHVNGLIKEINPAGYSVEILHGGVTLLGFMPNTLAGINKLYNPESIVGTNIEVMIESFSKDEGTYIVSRRRYLETLIPNEIKKLKYDQVYTGNVTGTTPFGVFVEFNECLTGMIHKANINQEWAEKIDQIPPGTEIDFYIKEIIKEKDKYRIILTQILRETLWDTIKPNQTLNGVVKSVKPFGILVSLDEETLGLIHSSEVEKNNIKLETNQEIKVKAIAIDRSNRKIFLSLIK
jgi:ribosomal protein S1